MTSSTTAGESTAAAEALQKAYAGRAWFKSVKAALDDGGPHVNLYITSLADMEKDVAMSEILGSVKVKVCVMSRG